MRSISLSLFIVFRSCGISEGALLAEWEYDLSLLPLEGPEHWFHIAAGLKRVQRALPYGAVCRMAEWEWAGRSELLLQLAQGPPCLAAPFCARVCSELAALSFLFAGTFCACAPPLVDPFQDLRTLAPLFREHLALV